MTHHRRPGQTTAEGYGAAHQRLRRRWADLVAAGGVQCARCGDPIGPRQQWDLGHVDGSGKREYQGPEHRACNRSAGAAAREAADPAPGQYTRW